MQIAGIVWFLCAIILTWAGFLWEVEYFRSPGAQFYRLLLALLCASPLVLAAYHRVRRIWFEWEPLAAALPVIAGLVYEPRATLAVIAIVVTVLAVGRRLCVLLVLRPEGPVEEVAVAAALGFGAWNCLLFVIGLAGLYRASVLAVLFAAALMFFARQLSPVWAALRAARHGWTKEPEFKSVLGSLFVLAAIVMIITASMVMLAPALHYDVNAIHLPLAHYYASQHALRAPAYLSYGYNPQSVEVLMTVGYIFGGDAAAQMLPPVFFALTLMVAYRIGRVCGLERFASFAGVVFVVATPLIHDVGSVAKNDLALAFFVVSALLGYLRWRKTQDFRWILAGAFFLSMGAGVKHIVIFSILPLSLLFLNAALRQRQRLRAIAATAAIFACFGLFWHARAWLMTGNPVYPWAASIAAKASVAYHGSVWVDVILPYLRFPGDVLFHAQHLFESPLAQPLGVALVVFGPLWILVRRRVAAAEISVLLFCGLYFVYWGATAGVPRFAIPAFALLIVLTADRVIVFQRALPSWARFSIPIASAYVLLFGWLGSAILEINAPQLRYFTFRLDRTGYLRETLAPYRALEFVSQASQPRDLIFGIDGCATVFVRDPARFDCSLAKDWKPAEIRAMIRQKDYRFIVAPLNHADLIPAGWSKVYGDDAYVVFQARVLTEPSRSSSDNSQLPRESQTRRLAST